MIATACLLLLAQAGGTQASGRISAPPQNSAMRSGSGAAGPQVNTGNQTGNQARSQGASPTATNQMTLTSGGGAERGQSDGDMSMPRQRSGQAGSARSGQQNTRYDDAGLRQQGARQNR